MSNLNSGASPNSRRSKNLAILAFMLALTIFFCFMPIKFGPVTLALMILPLLIIAQGYDFKMTIILAVFLAIVNQIAWYTTKSVELLAPIFQNPLVCMVPRILIGVISYYVGFGLRKAFLRPKYRIVNESKELVNKNQIYAIDGVISGISTAFGVLTNTLFVGLFTVLIYNGKVLSNGTKNTQISLEWLLALFSVNFVIEIISFSILVPPIIIALRKARLVPQPKMGKEIIVEDLSTVQDKEKDVETEKDREGDLEKSE